MKRIAIATILFTLPLLLSCESRLFHFVFDLNKTSVFQVDETGSFSMQEYISAAEILNEIDLPEDARITGVDVEALSLRVVVKPGNQAQEVVVSGSITPLGGGKQFLFQNKSLTLIAVDSLFGLQCGYRGFDGSRWIEARRRHSSAGQGDYTIRPVHGGARRIHGRREMRMSFRPEGLSSQRERGKKRSGS
jgi:hypothetical protein